MLLISLLYLHVKRFGVFSFLFNSKYILIYLLTSAYPMGFLWVCSLLFNFQMFGNFLDLCDF